MSRPATSRSTKPSGKVTTAWAKTSAVPCTKAGWPSYRVGAWRRATAYAWRRAWARPGTWQPRPRPSRCGGATYAPPPSAPRWAWAPPARCCCRCGRCRTSCSATAPMNRPRRASCSPKCPRACSRSRGRARTCPNMWSRKPRCCSTCATARACARSNGPGWNGWPGVSPTSVRRHPNPARTAWRPTSACRAACVRW